jgi:hypothetical protein
MMTTALKNNDNLARMIEIYQSNLCLMMLVMMLEAQKHITANHQRLRLHSLHWFQKLVALPVYYKCTQVRNQALKYMYRT